MLVVGRPKTGKTTFCSTWPDPLWINTDKGLATLVKRGLAQPYITINRMTPESADDPSQLNSWLNVRDILLQFKYGEGPLVAQLKKQKVKVGTIIIDSLTALSDILESEIVLKPPRVKSDEKDQSEGGDALTMPMYNVVQRRIYEIVDIGRELPYHFICTVLVDLDSDEEGRTIENPAMTGRKLGLKIPGLFNEVFMSYTEGGVDSALKKADKATYWLSSIPTMKARYLGARIFEIAEPLENPTFERLNKVSGRKA